MSQETYIRGPYIHQVCDYANLVFGEGQRPTDIDAFMEFRDRLYIHIEAKFKGAEMPDGQRKALMRITNRLQDGGAEALTIIAEHETPIGETIDLGNAQARAYWYKRKWHLPKNKSVRDIIQAARRHVGLE